MTENSPELSGGENQVLKLQLREASRNFEEKIFELSIIRELGLSLSYIHDLSKIFQTILDVIIQNTLAQNCSIMLFDHDRDQLFLVAACDPLKKKYILDSHRIFTKEGLQYGYKIGEGAAGQAVLSKEPVLVEDVDKSPYFTSDPHTQIKIGSLLSVPLNIENTVLGVLNLSHAQKNVFETKEINLFNIIANVIALLIHNAINLEKLKHSEEKYRVLAENSNDGIAILRNGIHVYANPAYQKITGYDLAKLTSTSFLMLLDQADARFNPEDIESLLKGECTNRHLKITIVNKNRQKLDLEINSTAIIYLGKEAVLLSARDLTNSIQLEKQLLHAQKMEAIGTLAGGIAHDFKNILQAITGFTELLLLNKNEDHPDYSKLTTILQSGQRANQLTHHLMAFSRKIESDIQRVDLNQVVGRMVELLQSTIPKIIEIRLDLTPNLPLIAVDPSQIDQVLMNLCINARDAMPDGGSLRLTTERIFLNNDFCNTHLGAVPGEYVRLTVNDNGLGMDTQTQEHIFEPFFTTKEISHGTGLGLSIVYGIVKNHGGYISCQSVPAVGTTFEVYLPVAQKPQLDPSIEEGDQGIIPAGKETILLVDDEKSILESYGEILRLNGYRVLTAERGEKAIEILGNVDIKIDLILLDLNMPGMSGIKCFEAMRQISPVKIVISSGFPVKGEIKKMLDESADGYIPKPYVSRQILKKVREVLDR
jgi:two-component system, cell cycle sensor histidine kinase and response regulator CckA